MVNRVVSTKITEEEHSKILEFCNDTGITVSTMIKQAISERIKKESKKMAQENSQKNDRISLGYATNSNQISKKSQSYQTKNQPEQEERYLYF